MDSGLKDDLVLGDPNAPRFVFWDGRLRPVPSSPTDLPIFDLMSIGGKIRAGLGAIGIRPPPPVCPLTLISLFKLCLSHGMHPLHVLFNCFSHTVDFDKGDRVTRNQLRSLCGVTLVMRFSSV